MLLAAHGTALYDGGAEPATTMDTLADLTFSYSRDLSALQADCRGLAADLDRQLRRTLLTIPAVEPLVAEYDRVFADARTTRDNAISQADGTLQDARGKAQRKRSDELLDVQQQYIDVDRNADEKKQLGVEKAERAYQSRLEEIDRTLKLDQQPGERRRAFVEYQRAIAVADDEWRRALRADRDTQQASLRATLERERRELDLAAERRNAVAEAADRMLQQSVKMAEVRFATAASVVPDAAAVQADFARRRDLARHDCQAREDALFQEFRRALKKL